jgi:hypothetical protein
MNIRCLLWLTWAALCLTGAGLHFRPAPAPAVPGQAADVLATGRGGRVVLKSPLLAGRSPIFTVQPAKSFPEMLAADPTDADGQGAAVLDGLCRSNQFSAAFELAMSAPAELQGNYLNIIFRHWGEGQPTEAAGKLAAIADPLLRSVALRAMADGWNGTHPDGLAVYAYDLPAGEDRNYALGLALDNWSLQDPAALGEWLNTLPPGPELDTGVALMLAKSDGVNRSPDLAAQWLDCISNLDLKYRSLANLMGEWAQSNPQAAVNYINSADWLAESQRSELLKGLENASRFSERL